MAYGSGGSSVVELAVESAYPTELLGASRPVSKPDPPVRCVGRGTPVSCALSSGHLISSSAIRASVKHESKHGVVIVGGDRSKETEKIRNCYRKHLSASGKTSTQRSRQHITQQRHPQRKAR
jgi:hypothetical protein